MYNAFITLIHSKFLKFCVQILDMTGAELKMVADHMGLNVNIHTDVYHLQNSIIEKTKVARVLMAMENGNISKYQGRNLQEILLEGKDISNTFLAKHSLSNYIKFNVKTMI